MEVRANYLIVGIFTLVTVAAACLIIYWISISGNQRGYIELDVVFDGSVTGLNIGSGVRFNGIRVGEVRNIHFDHDNPNRVRAKVVVDGEAPIKADTKAGLGFTGLTGVAYVDLSGGSKQLPSISKILENGGNPTLYAVGSPIQNFLKNSQDIMASLTTAIDGINETVRANREPLTNIISSVENITTTLDDNSDDISNFLASISAVIKEITGFADDFAPLSEQMVRLTKAVDDKDIGEIVANARKTSENLASLTSEDSGIIADWRAATATLKDVVGRADEISRQLAKISKGIDPKHVSELIETGRQTIANAGSLVKEYQGSGERVKTLIVNVDKAAKTIERAIFDLKPTLANINEVATAIDGQKINNIVANVDSITKQIAGNGDSLAQIIADAKSAATQIDQFTARLGVNSGAVDQIIADVKQAASQIKQTAGKFEQVVNNLTGDKGQNGSAGDVLSEVGEAMRAVRSAAQAIERQIVKITDNLGNSSDRSLQDIQALIKDGQRALQRIERAASEIENNPQRFLFGGANKPVYRPR